MSVLYTPLIPTSYTEQGLFELTVHPQTHQLVIDMRLFACAIHTNAIPQIVDILTVIHPSVLKTECFNEDNLPFSVEVQNTEIGHLFEHIMLAYLTDLQGERGDYNSVYNGVTKWNWIQEEEGTFHITIDAGYEDREVISDALKKSISLLRMLLEKNSSIIN